MHPSTCESCSQTIIVLADQTARITINPTPDISALQNNTLPTTTRDGLSLLSDPHTSPTITPADTSSPTRQPPSSQDVLTAPYRLRTTSQAVFRESPALIAHHGLPPSLPPPPRTTTLQPFKHLASYTAQHLNMIHDTPTAEAAPAVPDVTPNNLFPSQASDPFAELFDLMSPLVGDASPVIDTPYSDMYCSPSMDDFTSPLIPYDSCWIPDNTPLLDSYTPCDDSPFISTPATSRELDLATSPLIDYRDNAIATDVPLFPTSTFSASTSVSASCRTSSPSKPPVPLFHESPTAPPPSSSFTSPALLFKQSFPSPALPSTFPSPAMSQSSSFPSPSLTSSPAFSSTSSFATRETSTRKPSGFRSGANLIPLDAPTQPRNYLGPSSTAPKDVIPRKRTHDEIDESNEELDADAEKARLEAKRRKNALSARKSRQLKKETKETLEAQVQQLTADRDYWKAIAQAKEYELMLVRNR